MEVEKKSGDELTSVDFSSVVSEQPRRVALNDAPADRNLQSRKSLLFGSHEFGSERNGSER